MSEQPDRQVDDAEFLDIAEDPVEARLLRKSLQQLAGGGAGDALQEMAREVLSGRVGLRDAVGVSAYGEALAECGQSFKDEWDEKSENEREAMAAEGRSVVSQERDEMEQERRDANRGGGGSRHDGRGWSAN